MALPLCEQCSASGLPILLVRYTVVPKSVMPGLPGWAGGDRVKSVALSDDQHYALRTLREGYFYLFYEKNQRGSKQWECYTVGQDGSLRLQPTPQMAQPQGAAAFACSRIGHNNANLQFIVIEKPETCGATWIAFSGHKWSDETLAEYTDNTMLRNARMQTVHPAQMATGSKHTHGALADLAAIEGVLEYAPGFNEKLLPHEALVEPFSKEDGSYAAARLNDCSTMTPWALRKGQAGDITARMKARAKVSAQKENKAHVLAVWDATGVAHELNGYRNDAAGRIKQYGDERELQITAANAIDGLKNALDKKIAEGWNQIARNTSRMPDIQENSLRMQAVSRYAKGDPAALGRPLYDLDALFNAGQMDEASYKTQRSQVIAANSSNPAAMESEYAKIDQHRSELSSTRAKNLASNKQGDMARTWSKYQERLDQGRIDKFKAQWAQLLSQADGIIDKRTETLIRWLEAPLFIDTLEDFHPKCDADGVRFEDAIGAAIFGMGSCQRGAAKIEAWVKEAKASVKTNLVWRVVAMNKDEGVVEVDAALQVAYGAPVPLTTQAWDQAGSQIKWNKVFDLGKKSLSAFNTQAKAVNDSASGIKPLVSTRGLDKVFMTLGGHWVQPFKWGIDTVNEMMLRTLLLVRSGADPVAAKALAAWDAVHNSDDRDMLLRRLKNQDFYLSAAAKAQYEEHARKWSGLRANADVPDAKRQSFNAARDTRLALIVAVFEAFNLYKASAKAAKEPGSEKVQAQLTAAKLATAAAAIDVISNMVKALAVAGDRATTYQALKFGGGGLSVVASGYGAALDLGDARKFWRADDYRMGTFYYERFAFQAISATLTALTALSYCSPLIETFGKKFGERLAGQALSWAAKRLLLARAALVFASLEVSIFLLVVSLIIWYFEDDALQKWCDRSAFGVVRKGTADAYPNAARQMQLFAEALKDAA